MRTLEQQIRHQTLELISSHSLHVPNPIKSLATRLSQACQGTLRWFTTDHEPQIWSTTTKSGQPLWNVYDPIRRERLVMMSEEEVRVWLDTRYSR